MNGKKILVTGASGFIGSFIVEEALRQGMEVWAAMRPTSSKRYLKDERINFINLDLQNPIELKQKMDELSPDYVVHAAGATKCLDINDFYRTNTDGTSNLVSALKDVAESGQLKRFVFTSSLSIFGAIHESQPYQEICGNDTPHPNTAYGKSKLKAEAVVEQSGLPYVILRPTGVYGPREKDYFIMAKSIKQHSDFSVGYKPQDITFVYVKDVVQAVFLALEKPVVGQHFFLSDGKVYSSRTFSDLIWEELGRPWLIRIKAPVWVLRVVTFVGEYWGRLTHNVTALNNDKYNILRQRNWRCDITPACQQLGFEPQYDLERGVKETIKWYKDNKWL